MPDPGFPITLPFIVARDVVKDPKAGDDGVDEAPKGYGKPEFEDDMKDQKRLGKAV